MAIVFGLFVEGMNTGNNLSLGAHLSKVLLYYFFIIAIIYLVVMADMINEK